MRTFREIEKLLEQEERLPAGAPETEQETYHALQGINSLYRSGIFDRGTAREHKDRLAALYSQATAARKDYR